MIRGRLPLHLLARSCFYGRSERAFWTTDFTDDPDEDKRSISADWGSFCHSSSVFYQWNPCDPWSLASRFGCGRAGRGRNAGAPVFERAAEARRKPFVLAEEIGRFPTQPYFNAAVIQLSRVPTQEAPMPSGAGLATPSRRIVRHESRGRCRPNSRGVRRVLPSFFGGVFPFLCPKIPQKTPPTEESGR